MDVFIIILLIIFVIFMLYMMWHFLTKEDTEVYVEKNRLQAMSNKINNENDFTPTIKFVFEHCAFAFDVNKELFLFESETQATRRIPFSKIRDVQLIADNQVLSRKMKPNISGAVVGGMLAGDVGAIIGGTSGQIHETKCNQMDIKIRFNDLNESLIHECLYLCMTSGLSVIKKGSIEDAEKLEDVISTIIANNQSR